MGGKFLLHKKDYDFAGQVEARYDRVNNVLARREMIDLVQELNPHLDRPSASRQVSRHIIPKAKQAGYIKVFVPPQSTTIDRSDITLEQQFWWHTLVEEQYNRLILNNDGVCPFSGKYSGELMPYLIFGLDEESICADHHGNVNIIGSANKKKHDFVFKIVEFP